MTEELWERRGGRDSVHRQTWPAFDPAMAAAKEVTLVVQIDGKVRERITVPAGISNAAAEELALRQSKGEGRAGWPDRGPEDRRAGPSREHRHEAAVVTAEIRLAALCDHALVGQDGKVSLMGIFRNISVSGLPRSIRGCSSSRSSA